MVSVGSKNNQLEFDPGKALMQLLDESLADLKVKLHRELLPYVLDIYSQKSNSKQVANQSFLLSKRTPSVIKELTILMNGLSGKYIHESTKLSDFRNIFTGEKIINPVVWTGHISELHFMIDTLYPCFTNSKNVKWQTTCLCFIMKNGEQFDQGNLRKAKLKDFSKDSKRFLNSLCEPIIEKVTKV